MDWPATVDGPVTATVDGPVTATVAGMPIEQAL